MPEYSPDFSLEQVSPDPVAGIDEVGRGPWAGPVVAAAVVFPRRDSLPPVLRHGLNDSKTLSPARRQAPAVFAALDGLAGRTKDFINRILSQLPAGVSVWPVPKEEAPEREITDAEWEDIHTEIPEPPLPKKTPKRKKYTPVKKNDG